jgi:hypothetical protein
MEDLGGRHEAGRLSVDVGDQEVMALVPEVPSRESSVHGLVERFVEPRHLRLVAGGESFDGHLRHTRECSPRRPRGNGAVPPILAGP